MRMLVAHASAHGSTQGIAERIARRLRAEGLDTDCRPADEVAVLAHYDAVVLGSAVHTMRWLPEARRFALDHAAELRTLPTWLFSVSSVGDQESMLAPGAARVLRSLRGETREIQALRAALRPREHRNFAGAIARGDWSTAGSVFLRLMGGRYGDHRNWPAIDAWAGDIAHQLRAAGATDIRASRGRGSAG
jgi:menaquinone-dependent protoporphyrinogen oxidase